MPPPLSPGPRCPPVPGPRAHLGAPGLDEAPVRDIRHVDHQRQVAHRIPEHARLERARRLSQEVAGEEAAMRAAHHRHARRVNVPGVHRRLRRSGGCGCGVVVVVGSRGCGVGGCGCGEMGEGECRPSRQGRRARRELVDQEAHGGAAAAPGSPGRGWRLAASQLRSPAARPGSLTRRSSRRCRAATGSSPRQSRWSRGSSSVPRCSLHATWRTRAAAVSGMHQAAHVRGVCAKRPGPRAALRALARVAGFPRGRAVQGPWQSRAPARAAGRSARPPGGHEAGGSRRDPEGAGQPALSHPGPP